MIVRSLNLYFLLLLAALISCNTEKSENENQNQLVEEQIYGRWLSTYILYCSESDVYYQEPFISYDIEIVNNTDSTLHFRSHWNRFYLLNKKNSPTSKIDFKKNFHPKISGLVIPSRSKENTSLIQKISRDEDGFCDLSIYNKLTSINFIYQKKDTIHPLDSSYFQKFRYSKDDVPLDYVPEAFVISKSKDYVRYPLGQYPKDYDILEPIIWIKK